MKANELQIGDLVFVGGSPRKVCSITKKKIGYHREEYASRLFYARMYEVSPIHLTAEILEKNGFEKWSAQYRYRVLKPNTTIDKSVHFTLMKDGEHICEIRNYNGTHAEPRYYSVVRHIHELQRALRCCVLNELADSLKV